MCITKESENKCNSLFTFVSVFLFCLGFRSESDSNLRFVEQKQQQQQQQIEKTIDFVWVERTYGDWRIPFISQH